MSEPRLISPLLDGFMMGEPISDHHGVCSCPAIKEDTEEKYIVKIISIPASSTQMDALILSGAYPDEASALAYYKDLADDIIAEIDILKQLSEQEGFTPYDAWQLEPKEDGKGYELYLLRTYNRTLDRHLKRHTFTHLDALNLGLDICAALSVSRRSGYLYVDLKPGNVFVNDQQQYKIGGLGFIRMDSLKYASLPEKYRSIYTPAEISDAYSDLNTTMDIYGAGLILYQAYNNGELPFNDEIHPGDKLPAPVYADYEMSEIILKACDPDPTVRWQDPSEMGQAIVSYMQRNGAKDTPIIPLPSSAQDSINENTDENNISIDTETVADDIQATGEQTSFVEDEFGNLSFLTDVSYEDLGLTGEPEDYEKLSGETSEILNQADELATVSVPEPVVVPDHIDLPELEPIEPEPEMQVIEEIPEQETTEEPLQPQPAEQSADEELEESDDTEETEEADETDTESPKKHHWLRNSVLITLLLALLVGGYLFYTQYYLLRIDAIVLDGTDDRLTVQIMTKADETLLKVICVDTYGNQTPADVVNGKAEFTDLVPNTAYSIKIVCEGFHKVSGAGTITYSTPMQTHIPLFDAIVGASDGSVILNFTVEGPDSRDWKVFYSTNGERERSVPVTEHRAVVDRLTVGKEYTFRLVPAEELYLSGKVEIRFPAQKVIKAENLEIVSCMNNTLVAQWTAPDGSNVSSWTVSCSSGAYNKTITTTETTATFTDLDHTANYTVEVKANYMSVGEKVSIGVNTATVTDLKADTSIADNIKVTWQTSLPVPAEGWKLNYSVLGINSTKSIICNSNSADISPVIPNAIYRIWLTDTNDVLLLSATMELKTGSAPDFHQTFEDFEVSRSDLEFQMCTTSSVLQWDGEDLEAVECTDTFATGTAASFLVKIHKEYTALPEDPVSIRYIVRDGDGKPVYTSATSSTMQQLWAQEYCTLNIPAMPTVAGEYAIEIYFNGGLAVSQIFTIQ